MTLIRLKGGPKTRHSATEINTERRGEIVNLKAQIELAATKIFAKGLEDIGPIYSEVFGRPIVSPQVADQIHKRIQELKNNRSPVPNR